MDASELRLECLRLARDDGERDARAVTRARIYADFVLGTRDAAIIRAARDLGALAGAPVYPVEPQFSDGLTGSERRPPAAS